MHKLWNHLTEILENLSFQTPALQSSHSCGVSFDRCHQVQLDRCPIRPQVGGSEVSTDSGSIQEDRPVVVMWNGEYFADEAFCAGDALGHAW